MDKKIIGVVCALFALSLLPLSTAHAAPGDFIITVKTDNPGSSPSNSFTIPTASGSYTYNYNVDCGNDGSVDLTAQTGDATCTFGSPGTYQIAISGTFPAILFNGAGDGAKLISIDQWGTNVWQTMYHAFYGCSNMNIDATDAPDLSQVTDTSLMFYTDTSLNADLSSWDVSHVTNMFGMFAIASAFNSDITTWDTSSSTDMTAMFIDDAAFNQDISGWDTSNVTDMSAMFDNATSFNRDISTWNTGHVTNMSETFENAQAFNQDLNTWDTSNVTNMSAMFDNAEAFDGDISSWDTSNVTDMSYTFEDAALFNQNIDAWNVGNVDTMTYMFDGANAFNQDISGWDTGNVTDMSNMFEDDPAFNQDIGTWNTSNVTDMSVMFHDATAFDGNIDAWNTSNVTTMFQMFFGAPFNQDISGWDTSNVTDMSDMFDSTPFNQDISGWDTSNVTDISGLFLQDHVFNQDISSWNTSNVTDMAGLFVGDTVFNQDIGGWDTSHVTDMYEVFTDAATFNQDISGWDTSNVTNMQFMFYHATAFDQDLGAWNVSNVTNMTDMFNSDTLSTAHYDGILNGWDGQTVQNGVTFDGGNSLYCSSAAAARADLISTYGWTITDGGLGTCSPTAPPPPTITVPASSQTVMTNTPTISGTASSTASVTVKEGSTTLCTPTANGSGVWSCTSSSLVNGSHTISATQNTGGPESATSTAVTFSVAVSSGGGGGSSGGGGLSEGINPSQIPITTAPGNAAGVVPVDQMGLETFRTLGLAINDLVKLADDGNPATQEDSTVYYLGADGRRHAFTNSSVYFSWYCGFNSVKIISAADMAEISLGKNITYRPGLRLVKFPSVPTVYVVQAGAILRGIPDEATAASLFGANWNTKVSDISEAFYGDYTFGMPIPSVSDVTSFDVSPTYASGELNIQGYVDPGNVSGELVCTNT